MKRHIRSAFLLFFGVLFCALQVGAATGTLNWYTVRNKAHKQPVFGADLSFVEEYGGFFIDHAHTSQEGDKVVYLTFDAGYENGNVAKTLDILKQKQVNAAFFVLKHLVSANGDLVLRMQNEGHLVCNHTAHHPDLSGASKERILRELEELEDDYRALTGKEMVKIFRPPQGKFSREMMKILSECGYKTVFWSFAYADWDNQNQPSAQKALQCIMDNVHNGAVILLHPTSATNVQVLPKVIDELCQQGYRFGSLEELCGVS